MTPERWKQIERIFHQALDLPPDDRRTFLDDACHGDDALRARVDAMLEADARTHTLIDADREAIVGLVANVPESNAVPAGARIGPYRVLGELGRGGMGIVYRAHDERLDRPVALKFLPPHLNADVRAKHRFVQEARAASALDHPGICTVYDIGESEDGRLYIAMAFYEGATLKARLEDGPLPLDEALRFASGIAEGLAAAHTAGIVHRDVKPGNILITSDGAVKLLDFGLAKMADVELTRSGATLGTAAYMSPEQVAGGAVDRRTDVWSLGVVLYEMLTGKRPFRGEHVHSVTYQILHEDPDPIEDVRPDVPGPVGEIVHKALTKDPALRYQHVDQIPADIRALKADAPWIRRPARRAQRRRTGLAWGVAGALAAALITGAAVWSLRPASPEQPTRRFVVASGLGLTESAVSPDGRMVAFIRNDSLWVRDLARLRPRPFPGLTGAHALFWSPDSRMIGLALGQQLMKVPAGGGEAELISPLDDHLFMGAAWSPDGTITFATDKAFLYEVSERGGRPAPVLQADATMLDFHDPVVLPGRDTQVLVTHRGEGWARVLAERSGSTLRPFFEVPPPGRLGRPTYASSGHLLFQRDAAVWALPYRPGEAPGAAFLVSRDSRTPSVSRDGTLAFVAVPPETHRLVWVNRQGEEVEPTSYEGEPGKPVVSPDGRRLAVVTPDAMWIYDQTRGSTTRLDVEPGTVGEAVWMPNGEEVVYRRFAGDRSEFIARPTAGSTPPRVLWAADGIPSSWSPDGRHLVFARHGDGHYDLWSLTFENGAAAESRSLLATPAEEQAPQLSPDGRFIAYESEETGHSQVYIAPFPSLERRWQISTHGGIHPRWRRTGDELFYVSGDTLMATRVTLEPGFTVGRAEPLFTASEAGARFYPDLPFPMYDVAPDGERILLYKYEQPSGVEPAVVVVENWQADFE